MKTATETETPWSYMPAAHFNYIQGFWFVQLHDDICIDFQLRLEFDLQSSTSVSMLT